MLKISSFLCLDIFSDRTYVFLKTRLFHLQIKFHKNQTLNLKDEITHSNKKISANYNRGKQPKSVNRKPN